ncbi:DUF6265 family protein [Parasphingorhabdus sp.]|uniref:DUF6265 family protein n=1 Tax=Parasphingorhabdus sp. TaxID=2709688 RepID=UPI0032678FBB
MKMIHAIIAAPLLAYSGLAQAISPDWLAGCWETADKASKEVWVVETDGSLIGFGASVKNDQIGFYEVLHIKLSEDDEWTFIAHPSGQARTRFTVTEMTENSITFANPSHDYPQQISYRRDGDMLFATIAATGGKNARSFDKQRCE